MAKKKVDSQYILNEKISKVLLRVSTPLMINNIIATLYNLADGLFVAQLSSTQFAATSFVWPVQYLFIALCLGASIAGTSLIARYIGADKKKEAGIYANHVIVILIIMGVLFSFIGYLIAPTAVKWMGTKGDFYLYASTYLRINFIGLFFDAVYFAFQSILNAQGKTKETTIISGISGVINIVLDPFLIFETVPIIGVKGLGMEIAGAAIATVISKVFLVLMGAFLMKKKSGEVEVNLKNFNFQPEISGNIIRAGVPTAIGQSSAAVGFTIMNSLIVGYGEDTVAGFSMVNRIGDLIMQPVSGISGSITSLISQNLGAKKTDRSKQFFILAAKFTRILSVIGSLILLIFQNQLIDIFIGKSAGLNVVSEAKEYIKYDVFIIPLMGGFNLFAGVFQGTGNMKYSMNMSIFRLWIIRIPMLLIFRELTHMGSTGIWISMLASNFLVNVYGYMMYRQIDWEKSGNYIRN